MESEVLVVTEVELLVGECCEEMLVEQVTTTELLETAQQGPPGPPGAPGSILHTATSAEALGGHRAVIVSSAGVTYADSSVESHAGRVAGVTVAASSIGSPASFQSSGKLVEASWSWTPDADIWLGSSGILTQTYPSGAAFAQRMGYAISPTEMWIDLTEPTIH